MIAAIERLLLHWGEATDNSEEYGTVSGLSPIARAMAYGAVNADRPPRCSRAPVYWTEVDGEVDAVLAGISKREKGGQGLLELANVRYRDGKELVVEQQMRRLGIRSDKTYRTRLQRLHELMQAGLIERSKDKAA
ncbi:hypothetical protein [Pseudomonas oryzihabitans]|uniref:hypothetical protein n=1 Tax=Pseudomonas oryzihabitans TaxID=47885 RepID=UPI002893D46A|nr:hypothetical protein [Pseudomonas oryzihabitans]MDT3720334.1 hypothetical protein [Pseudomonas oryzihabitans]